MCFCTVRFLFRSGEALSFSPFIFFLCSCTAVPKKHSALVARDINKLSGLPLA